MCEESKRSARVRKTKNKNKHMVCDFKDAPCVVKEEK